MAKKQPTEITADVIAHHQDIWRQFTVFAKWSIIAILAILVGMALFLL